MDGKANVLPRGVKARGALVVRVRSFLDLGALMLPGLLTLSAALALLAVLGLALLAPHGALGWAALAWTVLAHLVAYAVVVLRSRQLRALARQRGLPDWVSFQVEKIARRQRPFLIGGCFSLVVAAFVGLAVGRFGWPAWTHGLAAGLAVGLNLGALFVAWVSTAALARQRRQLERSGD